MARGRVWSAQEDAALALAVQQIPGSIPTVVAALLAAGWERSAAAIDTRIDVLIERGVLPRRVERAPQSRPRMGFFREPQMSADADVAAHKRLSEAVINRVFSHGAAT